MVDPNYLPTPPYAASFVQTQQAAMFERRTTQTRRMMYW